MKAWALILSTLVVNVILADDEAIQKYSPSYDHVVNISDRTPVPGIGWTYSAGQDLFIAPVIDYSSNVKNNLSHIRSFLRKFLYDASNLSGFDLTQALQQGTAELSDLTPNEVTVISAITVFIQGGG